MTSGSLQEDENPAEAVKNIGNGPEETQKEQANIIFDEILRQAAQPKSLSKNACVRLCGFVDQASKSSSQELRQWALSQDVASRLFNFYMEWNETDQHRSMKLVLDLTIQLLKRNPSEERALSIKTNLLRTLISIVIGRSTKPVAKSSIKTLEYYLSKGMFLLDDIKTTYTSYRIELDGKDEIEVWRLFMVDVFHWMHLHFVCPTAGKFIVSLYRGLRKREKDEQLPCPSIQTWYTWLLELVSTDSSLLEPIKNYIFLPFFTLDRTEALQFLRGIEEFKLVSATGFHDVDASTLLYLAALETGKKVGLVEEPEIGEDEAAKDQSSSIVLQEQILESVLAHPSHEVRSLALSLLITCPSTIRPYSPTAFGLLQRHLGAFFADPDAKFRVDVLSKSRDMFKRVRGAICVLKRSIPRARAKAQKYKLSVESGVSTITPQPFTYRSNLITLPEQELTSCLRYHEDFLSWYLHFLCSELGPTVSYQRHIAALKALIYIFRMESQSAKTWETSEDQELFYDIFDSKWARALFDLVMDPFEDVRDTSASAIRFLFSDARYRRFALLDVSGTAKAANELSELSRRADELSRRTARADHSDGAAKACQLLYTVLDPGAPRLLFLSQLINELDRKVSAAETDLGRAVLEEPLHGNFAALSFTWKVVSEIKFSEAKLQPVLALQESLVACCERIWAAVRDILCDDSPEGHLPQELEDLDGLDTKDLLSYSFRSIHESSNLMRTMALTLKNRTKDDLVSPPQSLYERIGNLTFTQLSTLRHRGAFTTVSSTFATCCQQSKHLEHAEGKPTILNVWFEGTMSEIFSQASTTRRSAGIPSLMTGILSANPVQPSFDMVIRRLIDIASIEARVAETDGSNLPQVHAYNCLKDIFKSSLLTSMGNKSEQYLPECLELAASGLRSEVWAVRNCGLIFLRSLIDCLFGSHESKSMIEAGWDGKANRIPYHRYPNLPQVLMNLLKSGHQMVAKLSTDVSAAESVFPALDIVRRAGPPDVLRDEIQIHIAAYLSSPVWHVREIAARTLCSCLLHERWLDTIKSALNESLRDNTSNSQNHVHGVLLTLKFVFERLSNVDPERLTSNLPALVTYLKECKLDTRYQNCPEILAAYLEVVNLIWSAQNSSSQTLEPFELSLPPTSGSALLKAQRVINGMYVASQDDQPIQMLATILLDSHIGANTLVTALEMVPSLWVPSQTHSSLLTAFCGLYMDICTQIESCESQTAAIENLTGVLDELLRQDRADMIPIHQLTNLWALLQYHQMNPALSNALIRISGCILAATTQQSKITPTGLSKWGAMVADAGLDTQTFDTRFAAAESLRSFFAGAKSTLDSEDHLPILVALYDTLNDDDDEVREVGCIAAETLLGQAIVPIEAAHRLLQWLGTRFKQSMTFRQVVVSRIIGHYEPVSNSIPWTPAGAQLNTALNFDDSLFVVEDQNLFIDEVRETCRWIAVFESLDWSAGDEALLALDAWLCEGLTAFTQLANREDGPLGWASDPRVYSVCDCIMRGSSSMAKSHASKQLRGSLSALEETLRGQDRHISRLLIELRQNEGSKKIESIDF